MDDNELTKPDEGFEAVTAEKAADVAEEAEEMTEDITEEVTEEEVADIAEEVTEEVVNIAEETKDENPTKRNAKKSEGELAAENEARCDEALTTEKFCLSYMLRFKDLAKFNLRFSLLGLSNLLFWIVLIISIAYLVTSWSALGGQKRALIIILLVFLIWYVPLRAVINAAKSAAYLQGKSTPTEYHVCEKGFVICQDGQRGYLEYSKISRIQKTKTTTYAYVFRNSGFIFPKDLVGDRYEELLAILDANMTKK